MMTSYKRISYFAVVAVLAGALLFLATMRPQLELQPGAEGMIAGLRLGDLPDRLVEAFLWETQYLPAAGTSLDCCTNDLKWAIQDRGITHSLDNRIAEVEVHGVRFSSWRGLLYDLIDDDPTYSVQVEVSVTLENGESAHLVFQLWDYGLLVPWGVYAYGDGWKPSQVQWQ